MRRLVPDVSVGQVWEDCDKRSRGRRVKVIRIEGEYAVCAQQGGMGQWSSRTTRIRIKRMRPNSTGYRRVL